MKRILILLVFLTCLSVSALGQSNPPLVVTEIDGSPRANNVTTLVFSNGTVVCSSPRRCVVTTSGGGGASGANPTANVGLSAVNGSASTFLRSDGAPPLDQGIAPTWTAAHAFSNTITQTSASATAFASGANGATNPTWTVNNSVSGQVSGLTVTGQAAGTAPSLVTNSQTQQAASIAGNGMAITADPAIAGSSTAGAANGGSVTITAGAGARLISGNGNGGNIVLIPGQPVGSGTTGIVSIAPTANSGELLIGVSGAAGFRTGNTGVHGINGGSLHFGANNGSAYLGNTAIFGASALAQDAGIKILSNGAYRWSSDSTSFGTTSLSLVKKAPDHLRIAGSSDASTSGSLILGSSTVGSIGTSGVGVFAIANGTAPTSSPADTAQFYTADISGTAGSAGFHIRNEINTAALILPGVRYKTDTGDPTDVFEGMLCINTFDNTYKVYAEGAWRTITTW